MTHTITKLQINRDLTEDKLNRMIEDLTEFATDFMGSEFNLPLTAPIESNARLKRSMGRYVSRGKRPIKIDLAKNLLKYNSMELIQDTLKHELIHHALHVQGLPCDDTDQYFIDTCNDLGVGLTGTKYMVSERVLIGCSKCDHTFYSNTNLHSYSHKDCGGRLLNVKKVIV